MNEVRRKEDRKKCSHRGVPLLSLRELRRSRGLTQRELAKLAKVSPGTVYRLECLLRGAYPSTMRKLASALGLSPADLVRGHRRE